VNPDSAARLKANVARRAVAMKKGHRAAMTRHAALTPIIAVPRAAVPDPAAALVAVTPARLAATKLRAVRLTRIAAQGVAAMGLAAHPSVVMPGQLAVTRSHAARRGIPVVRKAVVRAVMGHAVETVAVTKA